MRIVRDPAPEAVETPKDVIAHQADVPIVVAAMEAKTDYLVTHNRGCLGSFPGLNLIKRMVAELRRCTRNETRPAADHLRIL